MNKKKIIKLESILKSNREKIINILITYESYETALYEINNSINFLENLKYDKELDAIKVEYSSIFLPINLPLYSLMLFVIIPCIISQEVFLRLPKLTNEILLKLYKILQIKKIFPNLLILEMERALFLEKYVRQSNVIIFTGKYENAIEIKNRCSSHSLFLFSGTGINPILITRSANINLAVKKTITMRIFNSGQDCAAPNIILVHNQIKNKFIQKLILGLKNISIGDYKKQKNRIGKLIDVNDLLFIGKIFKRFKEKIIYGGICDYAKSIIYPTVIVDLLKNKDINFIEFFSPIFYILI